MRRRMRQNDVDGFDLGGLGCSLQKAAMQSERKKPCRVVVGRRNPNDERNLESFDICTFGSVRPPGRMLQGSRDVLVGQLLASSYHMWRPVKVPRYLNRYLGIYCVNSPTKLHAQSAKIRFRYDIQQFLPPPTMNTSAVP